MMMHKLTNLKFISCNLSAHFTPSPQPTQANATTHGGVQAGSDKQSLPDKTRTLLIQSFYKVH